jgi:hypothetical protein
MNAQTILQTITLASGMTARHCTYDPTADGGAGGFWVGNWTGTTYPDVIFQVSMTGAQLASIPAATHGLTSVYGTAFDDVTPGGPYLWAIDADGGSGVTVTIKQIVLPTGTQTTTSIDLSDAGLASYGGAGGGMFLAKNVFGSAYTLMALVQNEFVHGWASPCADCPAAPDPFTATPVGTTLACNLAWTNPSTTYDGTPLSNISSVVIERNGTPIHTITTGITVGGNMTWTDNTVPSAGKYTYSVYAVNGSGNGIKATKDAVIGDMCNIYVEMWDDWGDGWNGGSVTVQVDGVSFGNVGLSSGAYGTVAVLVPSGELKAA